VFFAAHLIAPNFLEVLGVGCAECAVVGASAGSGSGRSETAAQAACQELRLHIDTELE
jgi:hypothetical protein